MKVLNHRRNRQSRTIVQSRNSLLSELNLINIILVPFPSVSSQVVPFHLVYLNSTQSLSICRIYSYCVCERKFNPADKYSQKMVAPKKVQATKDTFFLLIHQF